MLKKLYIKDYALIETLEVEFSEGMNVLTGETGAGKSIIMGALGLVMGARAEQQAIRNGARKCIVEAVFSDILLSDTDKSGDFDIDDDEVIIRREVTDNGKSRAFINDTPVSLNDLRDFSSHLLDIHSQHENLLLNKAGFQLGVVDAVAGDSAILNEYKAVYSDYKSNLRELQEMEQSIAKAQEEKDYLEFQFRQLDEAKLKTGEQEELEQELSMLEHAEEIKSELSQVSSRLDDEQYGVIQNLKEGLQSLARAAKFVDIAELERNINSAYLDLKEASGDVERLIGGVEVNPQRKIAVEERLNILYDLEQKHHLRTIAELIELRDSIGSKLDMMTTSDEKIEEKRAIIAKLHDKMADFACRLTSSRTEVLEIISNHLVGKLCYMGMEHARLEVAIQHTDFTPSGCDEVEFRFSANKDVPLAPISKIASGGEVARVMLALKGLIVDKMRLSTIVFDEIDTGVSGEMAGRMGNVMGEIAKGTQVITITHLPQIAAKGQTHFKVYKDNGRTGILLLDEKARINEIAEMLSGKNPTESACRAAEELMNL
ncbi:MAG: DNA repair protein RecN [Paludibacteraceae bacterium]|nr:DNA repair protein RecN [Paludibacteraceae bacterium]